MLVMFVAHREGPASGQIEWCVPAPAVAVGLNMDREPVQSRLVD